MCAYVPEHVDRGPFPATVRKVRTVGDGYVYDVVFEAGERRRLAPWLLVAAFPERALKALDAAGMKRKRFTARDLEGWLGERGVRLKGERDEAADRFADMIVAATQLSSSDKRQTHGWVLHRWPHGTLRRVMRVLVVSLLTPWLRTGATRTGVRLSVRQVRNQAAHCCGRVQPEAVPRQA